MEEVGQRRERLPTKVPRWMCVCRVRVLVFKRKAPVTTALLALEDGSLFYGEYIGVPGEAGGDVVFNTPITCYH